MEYEQSVLDWRTIGIVCSLGLGVFNYLNNRHSRNDSSARFEAQANWEEYKETAYDPILKELRCLENIARTCRRLKKSVKSQRKLKALLLEEMPMQLNEMENACHKLSMHSLTADDDWIQFGDNKCREISDFIADNFLSTALTPTQGLDAVIRNCATDFEEKLRSQKYAIIGKDKQQLMSRNPIDVILTWVVRKL